MDDNCFAICGVSSHPPLENIENIDFGSSFISLLVLVTFFPTTPPSAPPLESSNNKTEV
jgi:hypothetical protein